MDYNPHFDTARKKYINANVYEMAKQRLKEIIKITDEQIVSFSGGKDSLAVLNLLEEVYDELNINQKIKVCFFDEEVIPLEVVDFVKKLYDSGKYDFRWYCVTLESQKYVLGNTVKYVQWDKNREWVREKPNWAICKDLDNIAEQDMDTVISEDLKGRIASIRGIRADESLIRTQMILNKPNKPYIGKSKVKRVISCNPIYDWALEDVFLYFYKKGIEYCKNYDRQMWNKQELRVSTALVPEGRENFQLINTTFNPKYYERIIKVFPEMILQKRYYKEYQLNLHTNKYFDNYSHDEEGLFKFIYDTISDEHYLNVCLKEIKQCLNKRKKKIAENKYDILGGYPLRRLFLAVANGQYKKHIISLKEYKKRDYLFEGYSEIEYMEYRNNLKRKITREQYIKYNK